MDFNTLMIVTGWLAIVVSALDLVVIAVTTVVFMKVFKTVAKMSYELKEKESRK